MTKAELIEAVAKTKSVPEGLSKKAVQAVIDATSERWEALEEELDALMREYEDAGQP